jgi:mannosyl-3-phosphoglycerate phosphatase
MLIIFTDLDGTLIDHFDYSYKPVKQLLKKIKSPIVFCTSKTKAETEYFQKKLKIKHPFIVENGAAIYIPKKYFNFNFKYNRKTRKYFVIELGTKIEKLNKVLKKIKVQGNKSYGIPKIKSFLDMSIEELMIETNLTRNLARRAQKREYDIPFKIMHHKKQDTFIIKEKIKEAGYKFTKGGRFAHITGNNDKGKAVRVLLNLYKKQFKDINSIALGDSENDFPMLKMVDRGYLVQKPDRTYASNKFIKAKGIGPEGWKNIITKYLNKNKY